MLFTTADARSLLLVVHEQLHADGAEIAKLHAAGVPASTLINLYPGDLQSYATSLTRLFDDVSFAAEFQEVILRQAGAIYELAFWMLPDAGQAASRYLANFFFRTPAYEVLREQLAQVGQQQRQPVAESLTTADSALRALSMYLWLLAGWCQPTEELTEGMVDLRELTATMLVINDELLSPLLAQAGRIGLT